MHQKTIMDSTFLRKRGELLMGHLNRRGYCKGYFDGYRFELNRLIIAADEYSTVEEYIEDVRKSKLVALYKWRRETIIRHISEFIFHEKLPPHYYQMDQKPLSEYYKRILVYGVERAKANGKSPKTCQNYVNTVTTFFRHLQDNNICHLNELQEDIVLDYFDGEVKRGHTTSRLLIRFCHLISDFIGNECSIKLESMIPLVQKQHKIYKCINLKQRRALENVLITGHPHLTLRDRAICALALYTGLRGCDITNLKISDIDWRRNQINLIQVKTEKTLILKLLPMYGNLIYDYLTQERPKCKLDHVFVRANLTPLNTHYTYKTTIKVIEAAGLYDYTGKKGVHMLRHSLATTLIAMDTNYAIVTAALGHKSARSTFTYLSSEATGLRECSLPIDAFPINKDYFQL